MVGYQVQVIAQLSWFKVTLKVAFRELSCPPPPFKTPDPPINKGLNSNHLPGTVDLQVPSACPRRHTWSINRDRQHPSESNILKLYNMAP